MYLLLQLQSIFGYKNDKNSWEILVRLIHVWDAKTSVARVLYLMLQGAVLPLSLFTDDDKVQVVVASAVSRQAVHMNHVSKQIQFTSGGQKDIILLKTKRH